MTAAHSVDTGEARISALEQELGDFAHIVSHDLAASFRHIRGFSELLKQDAGADFTAEQNAWCAQIQTAAEKCAAMLEQLLVFSRAMRQPLNIVDCEFAVLRDTAWLQLGIEVRRAGAQILTGPAGRLSVDKELFLQALRALFDNAVKFRREGVPPVVMIEFAESREETCIRIIDNGIGLPAVDPDRLFGMFYRGHAEGAYPGCGAGLTLVRRLLRRHGGDARFVSMQDGACVEIALPRQVPAA